MHSPTYPVDVDLSHLAEVVLGFSVVKSFFPSLPYCASKESQSTLQWAVVFPLILVIVKSNIRVYFITTWPHPSRLCQYLFLFACIILELFFHFLLFSTKQLYIGGILMETQTYSLSSKFVWNDDF